MNWGSGSLKTQKCLSALFLSSPFLFLVLTRFSKQAEPDQSLHRQLLVSVRRVGGLCAAMLWLRPTLSEFKMKWNSFPSFTSWQTSEVNRMLTNSAVGEKIWRYGSSSESNVCTMFRSLKMSSYISLITYIVAVSGYENVTFPFGYYSHRTHRTT